MEKENYSSSGDNVDIELSNNQRQASENQRIESKKTISFLFKIFKKNKLLEKIQSQVYKKMLYKSLLKLMKKKKKSKKSLTDMERKTSIQKNLK